MNMSDQKIIVIGAGIGGLAVARALALRGANVTVLEQAAEITEVGAGLQISPNGFAVLAALGLDQELIARSVQGQAVSLRDYRRAEVLRLDLTRLRDQRYFFVHRADLIDILANGAREAGVKIRLLQKVSQVAPGGRPVVHLNNGAQLHGDLIIGADGLHSALRPALNTVDQPFFTGQVAWRTVVPNSLSQGPEARVYMGPGRHLVCYPLRDAKVLNVVAVQERRAWVEEGWNHFDDPNNLRAAFADFGPQVQTLLAGAENVGLWGLFRHPVAANWVGDNTALLGDAAHPTLPFMAQGACMALEDAWVLADRLGNEGDVKTALRAYQQIRKPRATRVVAAATGNAWKYHLRFPPLRFAAHMALRAGGALAPAKMMHQFDWIYAHDVTGGERLTSR